MTRSDSRRRFIRTLGMGALATPLLGSLGRLAFAEDGKALPRRLLVLYSPNGTVPNAWGATGDGAGLTFAPILQPLTEVKQHITVVQGLGFGGQFNTPHSKGTMMSLTNRDVFDGRPDNTERGVMTGPSLDTVLAEDLGKSTFRDVLRLTVSNATGTTRAYFNFTREGGFIRPQADPKAAFDFVFANATTPGPQPQTPDLCAGSLLAARKSVLDVITADAKRMSGQLPASQRAKLDQMLEAIRGQERVLAAQDPSAPAGVACDNPKAPAEGGSFIERTKRHLDTISAAFACDLVRFATLMLAPGADSSNLQSFRSDVQSKSYHDASHEWESAAYQPDLIKVNQYFAGQLAYIVKSLSNIPEGTGTVLDNTLILWTNECWHGNHDPFTLPIVLAGGKGLGLKGGRVFQTPKDDSQSYGKLLVGAAQAVGHSMTSFGDPRWGTGPLPGLFG